VKSIFSVTVTRRCRIRSGAVDDEVAFRLDADGFLDEEAAVSTDGEIEDPAGRLMPLSAAVRFGAVVLLGEPGLGKSTEFTTLRDTEDLGGPTVEIDAAEITDAAAFEELVGRHLRALPERPTDEVKPIRSQYDRSGGGRTVVIIDQVDESPIRQQLAPLLRRALEDRDTTALSVVLGCRTADYPANLTAALESISGVCLVADLAPLTRAEATMLASSAADIDGDALIGAAVESGAGVLANVPLTLELLVRAFRLGEGLDAAPHELFARGAQQLVDEHDEDRAVADYESTSGQRLAIAERIAARLLFSARRTIWTGRALDSGEDDVTADSLPGGEEQVEGNAFSVTKRMVGETLETGLFTGRGANRLAFRHGSFAAFLAARYLIQRGVPPVQLRALLLVPVGGTAQAIPTALRETAAWLINADAQNASWLVTADPESLVPHSPVVDSAPARNLLVEAMLLRATEIEYGDHAWARASRHLQHPGLDAQLSAVISQAAGGPPADRHTVARIRLAVRLAREASGRTVSEGLLLIAEHDQWDAPTRVLAAATSFAISPDLSADRLAAVLARLADRDHAAAVEPYDELAGTLLGTLWPTSLSIEDVLPFLSRPGTSTFLGAYRAFRYSFVEQLAESDVNVVLRWAAEKLEAAPVDTGTAGQAERFTSASFSDLLDDLVDRALSAPEADSRLALVAEILHRRLQQQGRHALPRPIDLVDADGVEPEGVRSLRHGLAVALIRRMVETETFDRASAWNVVGRWSHRSAHRRATADKTADGLKPANRGALLGAVDFSWLYELVVQAAAAGESGLVDAYVMCAALVFDLAHGESGSLAFDNQTHPVWQHVAWWFEPVPTDSEMARSWREVHSDDKEMTASPEDLATFHQQIQTLFAGTITGDAGAFWRLAEILQVDPENSITEFVPRLDDDLLQFPGIPLLPDGHAEQLTDAALSYLIDEHDHADEWVGQNRYDKRAWAGYLALALLHRQGRLGQLPPERWVFWVAAIVDFHAVSAGAGDAEVKKNLLSRVTQHAPQQLAEAVKLYLRAELARGGLASELELIDPGSAKPLVDAWLELATGLYKAITRAADADIALASDQTLATAAGRWERLLSSLIANADNRAVEHATVVLTQGTDSTAVALAARAGHLLLRSDPPRHLGAVLQAVETNPALSRELAFAIARPHMGDSPFADLSVVDLIRVYRWLSDVFPPEQDPAWRPEARFVGSDEQAREGRDHTLEAIASFGTTEAADALALLHDEYPERLAVLYNLVRCRKVAVREAWVAPTPAEVARFLADSQQRFARFESELRDALLEVLNSIAADLVSHGDLLWDRIPKKNMPTGQQAADGWSPKLEYALQAYLTHELDIRLARRGVIVNREVMIRPTNTAGAGDRADILVETATRLTSIHGPSADRIAVVIEVKGSWNGEVSTAQRTQLAQRYLPASGTNAGIYLVGWYPLDQWTAADYKRSNAARYNKADLTKVLLDQADEIRNELGMSIHPYLLELVSKCVTAIR